VKYHQLPSLEDAGLRYFKTIVFDSVKADVTAAIVDLINTERNGGVIDKVRGLISFCLCVFACAESLFVGHFRWV